MCVAMCVCVAVCVDVKRNTLRQNTSFPFTHIECDQLDMRYRRGHTGRDIKKEIKLMIYKKYNAILTLS